MKKRIISAIIALIILLPFTHPQVISSAHPTEPQFYITTTNIHLRTAPNTDADSLGVLPAGTAVQLATHYNENWYRVTITNTQTIHHEWIATQTGYMSADFLEPLPYQARFTGEISWLFEPQWEFDAVFPFHEGMAGVEIFEGEWNETHVLGYMNRHGEIIIPIQYRHRAEWYSYSGAPPFHQGRVILFSEDGQGIAVFDNQGNTIVPFGHFFNGWGFSEGLAAVQRGAWDEDPQWGFIDLYGNLVIDFQFDRFLYEFAPDHNPRFSEGLARVHRADPYGDIWINRGSWGFINTSGNLVVPFTYDYALDFHYGRAAVVMGEWEWSHDATWGFIDHAGNEVIPLQFSHVSSFSEGLAVVRYPGDWRNISVIDIYGNAVVPFGIYSHAGSFSEGMLAVSDESRFDRWGFIDRDGNEIVPPQYSAVLNFSEGLAAVRQTGLWSFIDRYGNEVIPPTYNNVNSFSHGLAAVMVGNWDDGMLWGMIDQSGNIVVPIQFDDIHSFSEGLAWARQGDLWGILQIGGHGTPIEEIIQYTPAPVTDEDTSNDDAPTLNHHYETAIGQIRIITARDNIEMETAIPRIEHEIRRGSTQYLPEDGAIDADMLLTGYITASRLREYARRLMAQRDIHTWGLTTNIRFSSQQQDGLRVSFPDGAASFGFNRITAEPFAFDRLTAESFSAAITINHEHIHAGQEFRVDILSHVETSYTPEILSRQLSITDLLSPIIMLAILAAITLILSRRGQKPPKWAIITAIIILSASYAAMFLWQVESWANASPNFEPHPVVTTTKVVEVTMSHDTTLTLSLPLSLSVTKFGNPELLVLFNESGEPQYTTFNAQTDMIDSTITTSGTYTLRQP